MTLDQAKRLKVNDIVWLKGHEGREWDSERHEYHPVKLRAKRYRVTDIQWQNNIISNVALRTLPEDDPTKRDRTYKRKDHHSAFLAWFFLTEKEALSGWYAEQQKWARDAMKHAKAKMRALPRQRAEWKNAMLHADTKRRMWTDKRRVKMPTSTP